MRPQPMLPVDGPLPVGPGWIAQPKLDGWRALVTADTHSVRIASRRGTDLTERFPQLQSLTGHQVTLDGELVAYGPDGLPAFHLVATAGRRGHLAYVAFDLLELDGQDLTDEPLERRLDILEHLQLPAPISTAAVAPPQEMWDRVLELRLEGVISKKASSRYRPGRSRDWIRTKNWTDTTYQLLGYRTVAGRLDRIQVGLNGNYITDIELGLAGHRRPLQDGLAPIARPGPRPDQALVAPGVHVIVRHHGPPTRPRDAHFITVATP